MGVGSCGLICPATVVADHNTDRLLEGTDVKGTHAEWAVKVVPDQKYVFPSEQEMLGALAVIITPCFVIIVMQPAMFLSPFCMVRTLPDGAVYGTVRSKKPEMVIG